MLRFIYIVHILSTPCAPLRTRSIICSLFQLDQPNLIVLIFPYSLNTRIDRFRNGVKQVRVELGFLLP